MTAETNNLSEENNKKKNVEDSVEIAETAVSFGSDAVETTADGIETGAALAAGGVAGVAGVMVGGLVADNTSTPIEQSKWNPVFLQKDKPLNQIPMINAHNVGTEPGQGTPFYAQDQSMSTHDILEKTPVGELGAIEFKTRVGVDGQPIVSHGPVDPTVASPLTFDDEIDTVGEWVNDPNHKSSLLVVRIGAEGPGSGDREITEHIEEKLATTFGDKLYTKEEFFEDIHNRRYLDAAGNSRWPTANELNARGKNVIAMTNYGGKQSLSAYHILNDNWRHNTPDYPNNMIPSSMYWDAHNESRMLVGDLGKYIHSDIVGHIDTGDMDPLIKNGGFIGLDHLSANDPRLMTPEAVKELSLDPDVSLFGGALHIDRGALSSATFGAGVFGAVGAGTFAIGDAIVKAYTNTQWIKNTDQNCRDLLKKVTFLELQKQQKDKNKKLEFIQPEHLKQYCKKELIRDITLKTSKAGLVGTTGIAASIFSAGLLFPLAFPVTSIIALGTLAVGSFTTAIATYWQRRVVEKKVNAFLSKNEALLTDACVQLNNKDKKDHFAAKVKKKQTFLGKISDGLIFSNLALRISSMAKYTVELLGKIGAGFVGVAALLRAAVDAGQNYYDRQKYLSNTDALVKDTCVPNIHEKRFMFFGSTPYTRFLEKNKGMEPEVAKKACMAEMLQKEKNKFMKQVGVKANDPDFMHKFAEHKIVAAIKKDVWSSAMINGLKVGVTIGATGMTVAPGIGAIFTGIGIFTVMLSAISAFFVARREAKKFKAALVSDTALHKPVLEELRKAMDWQPSKAINAETPLLSNPPKNVVPMGHDIALRDTKIVPPKNAEIASVILKTPRSH